MPCSGAVAEISTSTIDIRYNRTDRVTHEIIVDFGSRVHCSYHHVMFRCLMFAVFTSCSKVIQVIHYSNSETTFPLCIAINALFMATLANMMAINI